MPIFDQTTGRRIARHQTRSPHPVQTRRRTDFVVLTSLTASAISTSTYSYGATHDVSEYSEALLEISSTSLVLGSLAGLKASIELLSPITTTYMALPAYGSLAANPTATLTPIAGTNVIALIALPAPFGSLLRVGFTCTTAGTSGQISAALHLKG